jgi:Right handed beta helix region
MKYLLTLLLFAGMSAILTARTIEVRPGGTYTNLEAAAVTAAPGDTILFRAGVYPGGDHVESLQGNPDAWITIMAAPNEEVILRGGSNAWQLTDAAYLRISGFVIEGQTGNGFNLDDGGTPASPAHHLVIERCTWRGLNATGNNDELKMSGIDSFVVRDCVFLDGAAGGSIIDMVGCHQGLFTGNRFERGGSNSIQAKGGTSSIWIERNVFIDGGQRALNIGGSTGLQFFRPENINYEASNIYVHSNTFVGSVAPIAFVGAVNSEVVNNTIYMPTKWAIRILQETTEPRFLQCGDNIFRNNVVVLGNAAANPTLNIGGNTRPETFTFSNNLWYNMDNGSWPGPNLPVAESSGIIGQNPLLTAPPGDLSVGAGSPVIGRGFSVAAPTHDFLGRLFANPRSIGAFEAGSAASVGSLPAPAASFRVTADPGGTRAVAHYTLAASSPVEIILYDVGGARRWSHVADRTAGSGVGNGTVDIPLAGLPPGFYLCVFRADGALLSQPLVRR